jgi:hypothetical protein
MKRSGVVVVAMVAILAVVNPPASLAGVQVKTDGTGNFAGYLTYAWTTGTPARNPNMEDLIVTSVEAQLKAKGLARVDVKPNLHVATYVLPDKVTVEELRNSGLEFWSGVVSVSPSDLGAGTLVVDLIDAQTDKVVWRGVASETIKGTFKTMERKVQSAIKKMFKRYPPR